MAFSTLSNDTLTEKMRILDNGNVGIGNTNPNTLLDILGGSTAAALNIGDISYGGLLYFGNSVGGKKWWQ